jgi:hypothetical protein
MPSIPAIRKSINDIGWNLKASTAHSAAPASGDGFMSFRSPVWLRSLAHQGMIIDT